MIIETTKEWIRCLDNPAYAKHTWLRIKPVHEKIALRVIDALIVLILVGVGYYSLSCYRQIKELIQIKQYQEYRKTHKVEPVDVRTI